MLFSGKKKNYFFHHLQYAFSSIILSFMTFEFQIFIFSFSTTLSFQPLLISPARLLIFPSCYYYFLHFSCLLQWPNIFVKTEKQLNSNHWRGYCRTRKLAYLFCSFDWLTVVAVAHDQLFMCFIELQPLLTFVPSFWSSSSAMRMKEEWRGESRRSEQEKKVEDMGGGYGWNKRERGSSKDNDGKLTKHRFPTESTVAKMKRVRL